MTPTVQTVFAKELALIQDRDIQEFVINVFDALCPSYFWRISASIRGHHPPICRVEGGLVHHVKLAVDYADSFLDMEDWPDHSQVYSQVIAAVLLHDMTKRGEMEDPSYTWATHREYHERHGRYCTKKIAKYLNERPDNWNRARTLSKLPPILTAIKLHMGRWTGDLTPSEIHAQEHDVVVRLTHLADYAASRPLHRYLSERAIDDTMEYLKHDSSK